MLLRNTTIAWIVLTTLTAGTATFADEINWFSNLTTLAERNRSASSDLDSAMRKPIGGGSDWFADKEWSTGFSSPFSVDSLTGVFDLNPAAMANLSSTSSGVSAFSWKLGAGAAISFSKAANAVPPVFRVGPAISAETELRFSSFPPDFKDDPASDLSAIQLESKLRGNEQIAMNKILSAASLAAFSAVARADAEYSKAKTAYLEMETQRVEIELSAGRASRASYTEARDAWERARLETETLEFAADEYGREAWAVSGNTPPETGAAFNAERLYDVGETVAALCAGSDPSSDAAKVAAAPWDIRIAELAVKELSEGPRLSASIQLEILPQTTKPAFTPSADAKLDIVLPLDFFDVDKGRKSKRLSAQRREVADEAIEMAKFHFEAAERTLMRSKQQITVLETLASERATRVASWSQISTNTTVDALDSLAAESSMAETRAALGREKARYFLSAISAFAISGRQVSALVRAAAELVKTVETVRAAASPTVDKAATEPNDMAIPTGKTTSPEPIENSKEPNQIPATTEPTNAAAQPIPTVQDAQPK